MKTLNLRSRFAELSALPRYLAAANTVSEERAEEICASFGVALADFPQEFADANRYAQSALTRPDLRGNGLRMFCNAESLFFGYVYEEMRVSACDSAECARREEFD